jgi:hypothetical protein
MFSQQQGSLAGLNIQDPHSNFKSHNPINAGISVLSEPLNKKPQNGGEKSLPTKKTNITYKTKKKQ